MVGCWTRGTNSHYVELDSVKGVGATLRHTIVVCPRLGPVMIYLSDCLFVFYELQKPFMLSILIF